MKHIKIRTTDIFLDDKGNGRGKITVSDTAMDYNFSYYWGAMGSDLSEFIQQINPSYFAGKLCRELYVMDVKKTMANVRSCIKEELPWYKYPSAQKELRQELNEIQDSVESKESFVGHMESLLDNIICYDLDYYETESFKDTLRGVIEMPWNLIIEKPSRQYEWLESLLPKLQKEVSKQKTVEVC